MSLRKHNFSAGPAALPLPVLERVKDELIDFRGTGMSLIEQSHRDKPYEAVHAEAEADLRKLLGIPADYAVIFMGGGARMHFAMLPMNLLAPGQHADYVLTGLWAETAFKEAKTLGDARSIWSSAGSKYDHAPPAGDLHVSHDAAYLHTCSNNTVYGTQTHYAPTMPAGVPHVCDMSSDIMSRPVDVTKYGVIYAGAQKNMGPAGVVVLIVKKDLLARSKPELPEMFSYAKVAENNSMLNTPPVFAIYMVGLVAKHWLALGGLDKVAAMNDAKASAVYSAIDTSGGFYTGHAKPDSRSKMNVTFRLPSEELEKAFLIEADKRGLVGLKGHRSVGGMRASIYNAVPPESVATLCEFMKDFHKQRG